MSSYPGPPYSATAHNKPTSRRPMLKSSTLWAGGAAAALVAAGVAALGYLVVRGLFELRILGVDLDEQLFQPSMLGYAAAAALAALIATALMHVLLLSTPQPRVFFGWIVVLATALTALYPIMISGWVSAAIATAVVNVMIGCCIGTLVAMSARSAFTVGAGFPVTS